MEYSREKKRILFWDVATLVPKAMHNTKIHAKRQKYCRNICSKENRDEDALGIVVQLIYVLSMRMKHAMKT